MLHTFRPQFRLYSGGYMHGKLLLRFDDICPTMNWAIWDQIECVLSASGVKPLVAVIPDNRDREFDLASPRPDFWERVRGWQAQGWSLGVHGYQHSYVTRSSGLLAIHPASEFAGLSFREQRRKVEMALAIFRSEGVAPGVWVAPGHSFDAITLRVLSGAGLGVISDGFSILPYEDETGMLWVPQQMWRFRRMPFGIWTICFHPNSWRSDSLARFRNDLTKYREQICSFDAVVSQFRGRARTAVDRASNMAVGSLLRLKMRLLAGHSPAVVSEAANAG